MIEINLTGQLPEVNTDLSEFFQQAEEIMKASVQNNLADGGRPAFNVKHPNGIPLFGTGKMYRGVMGEHGGDYAKVYMDSSVVSKKGFFYPQALNDGFDVRPILASEGKLMVFEIDGHTVFTRTRKGYHVGNSPSEGFPFMIFQEEDKQQIVELLPRAIFKQQGEIV